MHVPEYSCTVQPARLYRHTAVHRTVTRKSKPPHESQKPYGTWRVARRTTQTGRSARALHSKGAEGSSWCRGSAGRTVRAGGGAGPSGHVWGEGVSSKRLALTPERSSPARLRCLKQRRRTESSWITCSRDGGGAVPATRDSKAPRGRRQRTASVDRCGAAFCTRGATSSLLQGKEDG